MATDIIDVRGWSKLLNMPYVERCWDNYRLGSDVGYVFGSTSTAYASSNVINAKNKVSNLGTHLNEILREDWDSCASFYTGLFVFCLNKKHSFIKFVDKNDIPSSRYLTGCLKSKKFPKQYREKIEKIWKTDYSFEDFITAASKIEHNKFNLKSAIDVYRLQGDKAILSILAQAFWRGSRGRSFNIVLTPELPISRKFEPSKFVSGVVFPCVVSKFPKKIKTKFISDGWFLVDDEGLIIDCVGVGQYNLWQEPLSTRLGYLGRGGISTGLICWCWGDIVKAVGYYGGDVLVRSLSEPLLYADWHKFGPHGKISVITKGQKIYAKKIKNTPVKNKRTNNKKREGFKYKTMMLNGRVLGECDPKEVVYSRVEMEDWFELAELCKKELRK